MKPCSIHRARYALFLTMLICFSFPAAASVRSVKHTKNGLELKLDQGMIQILQRGMHAVEVRYTVFSEFPPRTTLLYNQKWIEYTDAKFSQSDTSVSYGLPGMTLVIDKRTEAITFLDENDAVLLAEDPVNGKCMRDTVVAGIQTRTCETRFLSPPDEALYGLGCHPEDTLSINYKGRNQDLAIRYMTGAIPVLLSTRGYGLMWDNYSASMFYGGEENNTKFRYVSESGTSVRYIFFRGPSFDGIIAAYRRLTGPAPMFPRWAFGLFQSQDRYKSQSEVLSVASRYRAARIPVDCIVQDWFYWEPDVIGSHIMNPGRYPNPRAMVDSLHAMNLHAMISIWPVFAKGTAPYAEMEKSGFLTSITWDNVMTHTFDAYYDAHSPGARDIYWRQANERLITAHGWDAWWVDQCEPDNGSLFDARKQATFATGQGIDFFNTYSLMHTEGLYSHWRRDIPGKRPFFLVRQAFAGQQRNAAVLWSSDITCTWRAFRSQVPQGINACASGIPYWTSDIGGYHFNWSPPDWSTPGNRELFVRWFQFGAFCPVFRIHGKGERALFSDNWDAGTRTILLTYDRLRYRLLPYLYSLSALVTKEGYTIMRALAFDFKDDPAIRSIPDQYMFGPAFLVNPVTSPAGDNKFRFVYLPAGTEWIDFWTGERYRGGTTISAEAPVEKMPLFVKAGSIVPMGPMVEYASEKPADPIELRIYTGADGDFRLFEDENDGYGPGAFIAFHWSDAERTLVIEDRQGSFPGMPNSRTINIVLVKPGEGTGVEPATPAAVIIYNGKRTERTIQ